MSGAYIILSYYDYIAKLIKFFTLHHVCFFTQNYYSKNFSNFLHMSMHVSIREFIIYENGISKSVH